MPNFSFLKNLVGVKTDDAVNGLMTTLVNIDPKAASEAELRTMEQNLDILGRHVAEARTAFGKAAASAKTAQDLYDQRLHAAEIVSQQVEAQTDEARKAQLNKSLETLIAQLESSKHDVESAASDAKDAKEFLDTLAQRYDEAGAKLKTARADLERAQRDMQHEREKHAISEDRAEAARQAAGMAGATTGISTALKAMQDAAQKEHEAAEAANAKANLLRPSHPETEDPVIAAALAEASGKSVPTSLSDRLAALKPKAA